MSTSQKYTIPKRFTPAPVQPGPFDWTFRKRIREEIGAYASSLADEGWPRPTEAEMEVYLCAVCNAVKTDLDYWRMIKEDGDPAGWETDWFREYVSDYCTLYTDFPTDPE